MSGLETSIATELAKVAVKLDGLVDQLKESNERSAETFKDHESRIRLLERWARAIPTTIVTSIFSTVGAVILVIWKVSS